MKFTRFRPGDQYAPIFAAGAVLSVALSSAAIAQREPTPNPPSPTIPRPPQTPNPVPPVPAPQPQPQTPGASSANPGDSLSEKLDKEAGVLTPPPVGDPDIVQPLPDTNAKIKVIPPPGEPGGDPNVQPK